MRADIAMCETRVLVLTLVAFAFAVCEAKIARESFTLFGLLKSYKKIWFIKAKKIFI